MPVWAEMAPPGRWIDGVTVTIRVEERETEDVWRFTFQYVPLAWGGWPSIPDPSWIIVRPDATRVIHGLAQATPDSLADVMGDYPETFTEDRIADILGQLPPLS